MVTLPSSDSIDVLEEALRRAMLASDVDALDRLIHHRLLFVGPDGGLYHKEDDLERHRSGFQKITRIEFGERVVEAHDDVIVVAVLAELTGTIDGIAFTGTFRYGRTWMRTDEGFRIIAGSVTPVAK